MRRGRESRQIPAMDDPGANFDFSQIPGAAKLRAASCAGCQILSELESWDELSKFDIKLSWELR